MKASQTQLFKLLDGRKQFLIPIYQRTYRWTEKQCDQLWKDILRISNEEHGSNHFIGSIVYIEEGLNQASDNTQLRVIDGQQRLTTIMLLLKALGNAIEHFKTSNNISKIRIENSYLFNNDEDGERRYKLILTQSDKDTLINILEDGEISENHSKNLIDNFNFFKEQINKANIDLSTLYYGILKLNIIDIALDSNNDNPQLIFESLNSTGLELSQADLIRNYILMGLSQQKQTEIYNEYWYKIEESFRHDDDTQYFDQFMRDYLTIKLSIIPKQNEVYSAFKKFFKEKNDVLSVVKDIYLYSKFFTVLAFENTTDMDIRQKIHDINTLRVDVAYPFLLQIYFDFDRKIIRRDEFLEILDIVECYVFRRVICDIPTNSLNKTFAGLYKLIDQGNYVESFKAYMIRKDAYRRLPTDAEFYDQFQNKDVYNLRSRMYLFRKLENFERKELVNISEYTLEHIMPQNNNLSQGWRDELGENWKSIHEKYLHKVGNLTLTRYNSELGDKTFKEKQNMIGGFKDSPIRLNSGIAKLDRLTEDELEKRTYVLAAKALRIWEYPKISVEALKKYIQIKNEEEDESEKHSNAAKKAWQTRRSLDSKN